MHIMQLTLRTTDAVLAGALRALFSDLAGMVLVEHAHIFSTECADIVVSPANSTGRMDGGLDQVLIDRFGWQLEHRLMRDIRVKYAGRLPVGRAHLITTYDRHLPLMICAPTMDWPPGDVSQTDNAFLAFRAALHCAMTEGVMALNGRAPHILASGMATGVGRMPAHVAANQMRRAWDAAMALPNHTT